MAVIFKDGFDWYTTADIAKRGWAGINTGSTMNLGPTYARAPSGQGALIQFSGNAGAPGCMYRPFGANYVQGVLGFAVYANTSVASRTWCAILDGTTEQISLRTNASSVMTVTRNGTVLATGTTVLTTQTWYYFELKFTINNTTGVVEFHLNGATEIASTGSLNTRNTANTQWNGFALGLTNTNAVGMWFDDLYVLDTSTGSNTNFLGPVQIVARYANSNGNYSQWTPNGGTNMGCISEPYEDGNTSFNESATAGQIDTFLMQDLPVAAGSVYDVSINLVAAQDGGAARTIAPLFRISSTDYPGANVNTSTSYQFLVQEYDVSPATSTAWTVTEANGLEAGYKEIS